MRIKLYKRKEIIGDATLYLGDCMEVMQGLDKVDAVVTDPPYGTTACKWDSVIPLAPMWKQLSEVVKSNGAIVMTASQPFTTTLISSNIKMFKCEWIWEKNAGSNFASVKYQPMKEHENIVVFCKSTPTYNPIKEPRMASGELRVKSKFQHKTKAEVYGGREISQSNVTMTKLRVPRSIQRFNRERGLHPTQKPVSLMEYLIKTYTNNREIVLDFTMGSGTTGVACINLGRKFIGIEIDEKYFEIACKRISDAQKQGKLFAPEKTKKEQLTLL